MAATAVANAGVLHLSGHHDRVARPGPTTQRNIDAAAGNLLRLARLERGWSQRLLAEAAGVPTSTVGEIESGSRQPTLPVLYRLLAAADLDLRPQLGPYDDHDDVLDASRSQMGDADRGAADALHQRNEAVLASAHAQGVRDAAR